MRIKGVISIHKWVFSLVIRAS